MHHNSLDAEFETLKKTVLSHRHYLNSNKHQQIRINSWITKLQHITSNNIWRRNRNNYLRLLSLMLDYGQILTPFTTMAPNDLPTLHKHEINCCLLKLNRKAKELGRDPCQQWKLLEDKHAQPQTKKKQLIPNMSDVSSIPQPLHLRVNSSTELFFEKILSPKQEIKYFSKNRQSSKEHPIFNKIYSFLHRHQNTLRKDPQYKLITNEISQILGVQQVQQSLMTSIGGGQGISPSKLQQFNRTSHHAKENFEDIQEIIILDTDNQLDPSELEIEQELRKKIDKMR